MHLLDIVVNHPEIYDDLRDESWVFDVCDVFLTRLGRNILI
jgi:hypothetical protein